MYIHATNLIYNYVIVILISIVSTSTTTSSSINCIPDKSKDKLSLATVILLNADESQFNTANKALILQFSCPILDIYNYSVTVNNMPVINTTSTMSNITIPE